MTPTDIFQFCFNYPALVVAVVLGIILWSMVIMVTLGGGRKVAEKRE